MAFPGASPYRLRKSLCASGAAPPYREELSLLTKEGRAAAIHTRPSGHNPIKWGPFPTWGAVGTPGGRGAPGSGTRPVTLARGALSFPQTPVPSCGQVSFPGSRAPRVGGVLRRTDSPVGRRYVLRISLCLAPCPVSAGPLPARHFALRDSGPHGRKSHSLQVREEHPAECEGPERPPAGAALRGRGGHRRPRSSKQACRGVPAGAQ